MLATAGMPSTRCLAAAFTAFVTEGPLTGPAGGGFLLVHEPGGATTVLDCFFGVPRDTARRDGRARDRLRRRGHADLPRRRGLGRGSRACSPGSRRRIGASRRVTGPICSSPPSRSRARGSCATSRARSCTGSSTGSSCATKAAGASTATRRACARPSSCATLERIRDVGRRVVAELLPELADDLRAYRVVERSRSSSPVLGCEVLLDAASQGGAVVRRILELLAAASDPRLEDEARAVAVAYGPLGPGRSREPRTSRSSTRRAWRPAVVDARLGLRRLPRRLAAEQHARRARRDRPRRARRPGERLREHDDADARARARRPRLVLGSAGSVRLAGAIAQVTWRILRGDAGRGRDPRPAAPRRRHDRPSRGRLARRRASRRCRRWDVIRWDGLNLFFGGVQAVEQRADGASRRPRATRAAAARDRRRMTAVRPCDADDAARARRLAENVGREDGRWILGTGRGAPSATSAAICGRSSATRRRRVRRRGRGAIVGRLSLSRDPHPASRHVADLGLMVAESHRRRGVGTALLERGGHVGPRVGRAQARAPRLPLERAGARPLRVVRLRARGVPQAPLRARRRGGRRHPDGVLRRRPSVLGGGRALRRRRAPRARDTPFGHAPRRRTGREEEEGVEGPQHRRRSYGSPRT